MQGDSDQLRPRVTRIFGFMPLRWLLFDFMVCRNRYLDGTGDTRMYLATHHSAAIDINHQSSDMQILNFEGFTWRRSSHIDYVVVECVVVPGIFSLLCNAPGNTEMLDMKAA